MEIRILDAKGEVVRKLKVQGKIGENEIIWDGCDEFGRQLPPGNYFYQLRQNGKMIGNTKGVKIE